MSDLVTIDNGQLVTSSRKVAESFDKEHRHVLESIRDILAAEKSAAKFFHETTYENRGKQYPEYLMNRDGFSLLVMGFNGKAALKWKIKYIDAFNKMEKAIATPQLKPNPHYRTRMVKTAVTDIGGTAQAIMLTYHVKPSMALAAAQEMVGKAYGIDTTPLQRLIPAEAHPGYLNAGMIAERQGLRCKTGKPNAVEANKRLEAAGLMERHGKHWRLTEKGRQYGEEKPYVNHGHSDYQIVWSERVYKVLK